MISEKFWSSFVIIPSHRTKHRVSLLLSCLITAWVQYSQNVSARCNYNLLLFFSNLNRITYDHKTNPILGRACTMEPGMEWCYNHIFLNRYIITIVSLLQLTAGYRSFPLHVTLIDFGILASSSCHLTRGLMPVRHTLHLPYSRTLLHHVCRNYG